MSFKAADQIFFVFVQNCRLFTWKNVREQQWNIVCASELQLSKREKVGLFLFHSAAEFSSRLKQHVIYFFRNRKSRRKYSLIFDQIHLSTPAKIRLTLIRRERKNETKEHILQLLEALLLLSTWYTVFVYCQLDVISWRLSVTVLFVKNELDVKY